LNIFVSKPIVNEARAPLAASLKLAQTAWNNASEHSEEILPLGRNETQVAYEAMLAIEKKIEDFFERTHLTAYHPEVSSTGLVS
jgi:hypothetical protein